MKTQAIIPTAGIGERLQSSQHKPLVKLNDKPLIIHTLEAFEKSSLIDSVVLVVHEDFLSESEKIVKQHHLHKVSKIVIGGKTRSASVCNGLSVLDNDTDIVMVHDGARPLVTADIIDASIKLCESKDAVVAAVAVKSTIKKINQQSRIVEKTLDRQSLWEIQTPQVFKKAILIQAHEKGKNTNPTDDASLVEALGVEVHVLEGDYKNIKITTEEDLMIAKTFLCNQVEV